MPPAVLALLASHASALQAAVQPELHAVRNVRFTDAPDAAKSILVLRGGRVEAVLPENGEIPRGARIVDANGALALPAFIDAHAFAGFEMPKPVAARDMAPKSNADVLVDMREANRKGIQPAFRAADAFNPDKDADKRYRASGFGAWLAAPHGELLSGISTLVTAREAAARDRIRSPLVFAHGGFDATGPGYPGTLMGSMAQLRQFFLDALWTRELEARQRAGKPGRRAPYDNDLLAIRPVVDRERRLVCEAESAADIERWIGLADEHGFDIAISGGRDAWRRARLLAERKIPVVLTLQWGEEVDDPHAKETKPGAGGKAGKTGDSGAEGSAGAPPQGEKPPDTKPAEAAQEKPAEPPAEKPDDDVKAQARRWIYEEPLRVREEKRRLWLEKRDCALRLHEAGVAFAFGSGKDAPKELLERVRKLVEAGLARDAAQHALTAGAAEFLGLGASVGKLEAGFDATFAIWSKHPLADKDAKLVWLFVDGVPYEFELDSNELKGRPDEGVDVSGSWTLEFEDPDVKRASAELTMTREGVVRGVFKFKSPFDDADLQGDFEGQVAGKKLRVTGRVKIANFESDVTVEGELEGQVLKGTTSWKWSGGENTSVFKAERKPERVRDEGDGLDDAHGRGQHDPHREEGR